MESEVKQNHSNREDFSISSNHKDYQKIIKKMLINEKNEIIDPYNHEQFEQYLCCRWIQPHYKILELGARYGIVSCTINSLLKNKKDHVVIEPDLSVINALKKNKNTMKSQFQICNSPISNTPLFFIKNNLGSYTTRDVVKQSLKLNYSTQFHNLTSKIVGTPISSITYQEFQKKYPIDFDVLVVDCEGCLESFFKENSFILDQVKLIIFEKDNEKKCNYNYIFILLESKGFVQVDGILKKSKNKVSFDKSCFQQVWCNSSFSK